MLEDKNNACKTVSLFQPSNMAAVKTHCTGKNMDICSRGGHETQTKKIPGPA